MIPNHRLKESLNNKLGIPSNYADDEVHFSDENSIEADSQARIIADKKKRTKTTIQDLIQNSPSTNKKVKNTSRPRNSIPKYYPIQPPQQPSFNLRPASSVQQSLPSTRKTYSNVP